MTYCRILALRPTRMFLRRATLRFLARGGCGRAPALPALLLWHGAETAEDTHLWHLAEAALELGKARKLRQREHGVPQRHGLCIARNPRNDRPKKRQSVGRLERDDRGPHVAACTAEGECGLRVKFGIPAGVVSRRSKLRGEPHCVEHLRDVGHRAQSLPHPRTLLLIPVRPPIPLVDCSHPLPTQSAPHFAP